MNYIQEIKNKILNLPSIFQNNIFSIKDILNIKLNLNQINSIKKENVKKIICIGDSITQFGYPEQLANSFYNKHRSNVIVKNFGISGSCAMKQSDIPYINQYDTYESSLNEENVDVVIIMFGTNDSKSFQWNKNYFISDYLELINTYKHIYKNIIILIPPPAFKTLSDISNTNINTIKDLIIQWQAIGLLTHIIDTQIIFPSFNNTTMSNDGIHPTITGDILIADLICNYFY